MQTNDFKISKYDLILKYLSKHFKKLNGMQISSQIKLMKEFAITSTSLHFSSILINLITFKNNLNSFYDYR